MKKFILLLIISISFVSCSILKQDKNNEDLSKIEPIYDYNNENDIIIDTKYNIMSDISDNYFVIKNDENKYNFMDLNGNLLNDDFKYTRAFNFSDELAAVCEKNNCYYINTKGEKVLDKAFDKNGNELEFNMINDFVNGLAAVNFKNKSLNIEDISFIDTKGNILENYKSMTDYKYKNKIYDVYLLHETSDNDFIFYMISDETGGYGIYDRKNNKFITKPTYNINYNIIPKFINGKAYIINKSKKLLLINEKGEVLKKFKKVKNIYPITFDKIVVNYNKESIILDMEGNEVLKTNKYLLNMISDNMVKCYDEKNNKYSIINLNDELILKNYDNISNIYNNTVLLVKDGKTIIHKFE